MSRVHRCIRVMACAISGALAAQAPFAAQVISWDTRGNLGGGIFMPTNALGAPLGGGYAQGGTHVHSLGIGGNLVLQLAIPARDGPGADLLVAENAFGAGDFGRAFAEAAYVEVSSNRVDFARFPARYTGPQVEPGAFGTVAIGDYENLAGITPVLFGSAAYPAADAQDVVEAGGDAFDLADLTGDPLVVAGRVQLGNIGYVRLVDVRSGIDGDAAGRPIRDCGSGSADIDAVTAIHHQQNLAPNGPVVGLSVAADGRFVLTLDDPDGWQDFDGGSLRTSLQGLPVDAAGLLSACVITRADAFGFTLALPVPLPPEIRYRLAVSIKDRAGHRSGVARARP